MAKKVRKKTTWQKTRKLFNDIHLWVGLISGIVVVVICFSGTIYTYNTELREWAAPHLHQVAVPADTDRIPAESLLPKITELSGGTVTAVGIPADPARTYTFTARVEGDNSRRGTIYYVNPYTGAVTGSSKEVTKTDEFMQMLFSLHRWLLLDRIEEPLIGDLPNRKLGSYLSGAATILFTLGVLTGMVIWFPQKLRNWRQGLAIKWSANWKRINHDLHNSLAFYSLIFLFVMGITGPQWSFPWYRTGLQKALGTYQEQPAQRGGDGQRGRSASTAVKTDAGARADQAASTPLLPFSAYLAATDVALPYMGDYQLSLPQDGAAALSIRKNRTGFFAPAASDQVTLDATTAKVTEVAIFRDKPFNERVASSIKALHVGNVYGPFTKLLYFLACLVATTLPITGTMIWLNKMKKRR
ncbi:PepSY-associated TM helix domain-containing protein [Parapedobacter sp.]